MIDTTIDLVRLALDAALMRQTAIATNIANINTKDYQAMAVDFEKQLNESNADTLANIKPMYTYSDTPLSIDEQLASSVQNATQYRALIKGLNHKLAIMTLAVQGNNA